MAAISVEDLKSLAQHIHGQPKSIARLVDEFHEKYSQYLKRNIEAQIKQMTKYEKRGADTRLKYYLSKEIQEKYGIEDRIDALAANEDDLKALAQHIHGQKGFARLVVSFREKHSKYSKREIEVQIKQMTVYEKRGADTRLNYYLTKELQEKYGIEVNIHAYIYIKGVRMRAMRATNQLTTFVGNATTIGSREATGPPNPASTEIYLWD